MIGVCGYIWCVLVDLIFSFRETDFQKSLKSPITIL